MDSKLIASTEECFAHFTANHRDLDAIRVLAEFCGVQMATVLKWIEDGPFPEGETLIRLRCFLELTGLYQIVEMYQRGEQVQWLAMGIALQVFSVDEAREALGFDSQGAQSILRILLRARQLSPKVEKLLPQLNRKTAKTRTARENEWRQRIQSVIHPKDESDSSGEAVLLTDPAMAVMIGRLTEVLVTGLYAALRSDDVRQQLSDRTKGGQTLHELRDLLNQLLADR